jgi:hypothetical protein
MSEPPSPLSQTHPHIHMGTHMEAHSCMHTRDMPCTWGHTDAYGDTHPHTQGHAPAHMGYTHTCQAASPF